MKEQVFESVWDAIENSSADASAMKARAALMIAIRDVVAGWAVTQVEAARRLGVTQPRMSDLLRGQIDRFSLDTLVNLAARAGLSVSVEIRKSAA
jgi:predicted XRE-type DNA-binding protein